MRANRALVLVCGLAFGCGTSSSRPPALECPDGSSCAGSNPAITGTGTPGGDAGAPVTTGDAGLALYNLAGNVAVLNQVPPTSTVSRSPVAGWTVVAANDPLVTATTADDGTFTLMGVLPFPDATGVPVLGVRAIPPSVTSLGTYREIRAGGGSLAMDTFGSEVLLQAVSPQGGAPSPDLGHVVVRVVEATDPSIGVVGAVVNASSASTTFYDNDSLPGQLSPAVTGTGMRGFALVLNVPAGDAASGGGTVTLTTQVAGATPVPATQVVRVFPNTVSWLTVRVTR